MCNFIPISIWSPILSWKNITKGMLTITVHKTIDYKHLETQKCRHTFPVRRIGRILEAWYPEVAQRARKYVEHSLWRAWYTPCMQRKLSIQSHCHKYQLNWFKPTYLLDIRGQCSRAFCLNGTFWSTLWNCGNREIRTSRCAKTLQLFLPYM